MHDKIKALTLLGQHLGIFITIEQLIDKMSDSELDKITEKLLAKVKQSPQKAQDDEDESASVA
jgi:hypothetical protein